MSGRLPHSLRLVLDEDITWRLAPELRRRGLDASSIRERGWLGLHDAQVLRAIADEEVPSILVTFDQDMLYNHRELVARLDATIGIVDSASPRAGLSEEQHLREVIHRWAHRLAGQPLASRAYYSLAGRRFVNLAKLPRKRPPPR